VKKISIKGTGCYLPERIVPNSYFEKIVDTSDEWIFSRTGIRERRMVLPGQALSDIATPACENALEMAGLSPKDLDLIIVGTSTADMTSPSAGCMIQYRLGAKNAVAFDVNAACPGFIYGLTVAQKFMQNGSHQHVLVVGGEIISHRIDYQDRATCVLFGDGAGAVILGGEEGDRGVLSTHLHSDGSLWELLYMPGGGSAHPSSHETVDQHLHCIKMTGNQLFKVAVRALAEVSQEALKFNGLTSQDIDLMIPHQANMRIIEAAAKLINFPMDKVFLNIERYGNTSSATIPIALDELNRGGKLKAGNLILLCSFGTGVTWGGAVIRW